MSAQPPNDPSGPHRRRPRPNYGLPGPDEGPQAPAPGTPGGAPGVTGGDDRPASSGPTGWSTPADSSSPQQPHEGQQPYGAQETYGGQQPYGTPQPQPYGNQQPYGAQQPYGGQQPYGAQQAYGTPQPQWGGPAAPVGPQPKRKGVWQLIVGVLVLISSVVVALVMLFGSALSPVVNSLSAVETVDAGTAITLEAGEVRMVALASSDIAAGATCAPSIPSSQGMAQPLSSPLPQQVEGQEYEVVHQVAAYSTGEFDLNCTGTTHPVALTGAIDTGSLGGGLLGALAVGTVLGLIGLGLIVWGIIALVRSGRRIKAWREGRPS